MAPNEFQLQLDPNEAKNTTSNALPISTKINMASMKPGASASKVATASPNNAPNLSKGTGLDGKGINVTGSSGHMSLGQNEAAKLNQNQ